MPTKLSVNPIACSGHGMCAELLPELIALDEWGYPLISGQPVPLRLVRDAKRAVTDCPALALRLTPAPDRAGPKDQVRDVPFRALRSNSEVVQTDP